MRVSRCFRRWFVGAVVVSVLNGWGCAAPVLAQETGAQEDPDAAVFPDEPAAHAIYD
jgi:hypothetical protein